MPATLRPFISHLPSPFLVLSPCLYPGHLCSLIPNPKDYKSQGLPSRSQPICGPWLWGSSWVISHPCPGMSKPLSSYSDSRDCYFKPTLWTTPEQSYFVCQGPCRTPLPLPPTQAPPQCPRRPVRVQDLSDERTGQRAAPMGHEATG